MSDLNNIPRKNSEKLLDFWREKSTSHNNFSHMDIPHMDSTNRWMHSDVS